SDVSRLNREAAFRETRVDSSTYEVLEGALNLYRRSEGIFDIAIAPALQKQGLLPGRPDSPAPVPAYRATGASSAATALLSGNRVRFYRPDVSIDLGGVAKGFAVDRAIDALKHHGIPSGLVNAGGDLAAFGPASYTVHIRDPRLPSQVLCVASMN